MLIHEEFTRCDCGAASLKRETVVLANYQKDSNGYIVNFSEIPGRTETHFICTNCGVLIHKMREK